MAFLPDSSPGSAVSDARSDLGVRGLGAAGAGSVGTFSKGQTRIILIVAVTTASLSLAVALVSLRWFLSMKRSFRHHLVLMLIISDSMKALWYFLSPVIIFSRGEIRSSSRFAQASGFLLAVGVEGADLSILFIALHTALYIFRPPKELGHGGLYRYRYWVYGTWLILPVLAAGLAFTNRSGLAYVTFGTVAYLPKRPFWYRLALAWIPRYAIFLSIIAMYAAIYLYVKVKFNGFDNCGSDMASFDTGSTQFSTIGQVSADEGSARSQSKGSRNGGDQDGYGRKPATPSAFNLSVALSNDPIRSQIRENNAGCAKNDVSTTSRDANSQRNSQLSLGIAAADFASEADSKRKVAEGRLSPVRCQSQSTCQAARSGSNTTTINTDFTNGSTVAATPDSPGPTTVCSSPTLGDNEATDHLMTVRIAIRRQLRFLFLYPLIYLLMWSVPFVQHCLTYTDKFTEHPVFGLNVGATFVLALQAGVDCAIFSWRERPWTRMRGPPFLSVMIFQKLRARFWARDEPKQRVGDKDVGISDVEAGKAKVSKRDAHWWEEEGRRRKDSVWLGTDTVNDITRTQTAQSARVPCQVE